LVFSLMKQMCGVDFQHCEQFAAVEYGNPKEVD